MALPVAGASLAVREKMRWILLFPLLLALVSCGNETDGTPSSDETMQRIVLRVREKHPDEVYRMLWQRSFPNEYEELIRSAEQIRQGRDDPFAQPMAIPDSELTPDSFSTGSEWGKGLPGKVFEQLGFPIFEVEDGVLVDHGRSASWNFQSGVIEIHHSAQAIAAFRSRFPEFEDEGEKTREEDAAGKAATRPELE